jgi:protein-tyrosine phosphatase
LSAFHAVFVCTGNRFRSPLAAAVFRSESERLGAAVEVESYGVLELDGAGPLPEALELGSDLGVDLASHRSRALRPEALGSADVVVGFERMHVVTAVMDAGAPRNVAFTLPQLVQLLGAVPSGAPDARARIAAAAERRGGFGDIAELEDPLGRPRRRQEEIAALVAQLTTILARRLFA